jgi:MFS transporter, FHS family, L-fucose permease
VDINTHSKPTGADAPGDRRIVLSVFIIGILFFVFGFVSWVNAILVPYFKIAFELSNFQSYLVTFAFYISYLVISVPSSLLIKRIGFKRAIMTGFWVMAAGALIFVPAALTKRYGIFLVGLFSLGAGLAVLQTAANPYVTLLGPIQRAGQRISIMGICNKGAGILAPLIFAAVILKASDNALFGSLKQMDYSSRQIVLGQLLQRVIGPYSVVAAILFCLGLVVRYSPLPEINTEEEAPHIAKANSSKKTIFGFPHLILAAIAIFLHVGTQVIAIDTLINYAASMNIPLQEAKVFPSYTLAATICGYLLGNSLIWAGIWPLAMNGLGRFTKLGSSILIMGLCGNAVLPLLYGYFADRYDLRTAYWVLFPCYPYLVFFSFYGYRITSWRFRNAASKTPTNHLQCDQIAD